MGCGVGEGEGVACCRDTYGVGSIAARDVAHAVVWRGACDMDVVLKSTNAHFLPMEYCPFVVVVWPFFTAQRSYLRRLQAVDQRCIHSSHPGSTEPCRGRVGVRCPQRLSI